MKNIVIALSVFASFSVSTSSSAESWFSINNDNEYIDLDSIRIIDGLVKYWSKEPDELMTDKRYSTMTLYAVNCRERAQALIQVVGYDPGGNAWINVSNPRHKWSFAESPPGSRGERSVSFVCAFVRDGPSGGSR